MMSGSSGEDFKDNASDEASGDKCSKWACPIQVLKMLHVPLCASFRRAARRLIASPLIDRLWARLLGTKA